jgi:hypothetical protein
MIMIMMMMIVIYVQRTSHRVWGRAKLRSVPQNTKSYLK